jgi:ABC-type sugar transport system ATPase subunit
MEISRLHHRLQNTVVYVTHDQVEAMTLADRIVVLEGGVIRQIGAPLELYERPANRFVAGFIGTPTMAFLSVASCEEQDGRLAVKLAGQPDQALLVRLDVPASSAPAEPGVTLGVRPEHCRLCALEGALLTGTIVIIERLGADTFAFVDVPGAEDTVAVRLADAASHVTVGERVGLQFGQDKAHLFNAQGLAVR